MYAYLRLFLSYDVFDILVFTNYIKEIIANWNKKIKDTILISEGEDIE